MQSDYFAGKVPDRSESKDDIERCCICDEPTGHAGRADDSLYCECGAGPFCRECLDEHNHSPVVMLGWNVKESEG